MSLKPINDNRDPLYRLLREGRIDEFNARKRKGEKMDLTDSDLGGLDLREVDLKGSISAAAIFSRPICAASIYPKPTWKERV
ncbi:MAG: hypothetical protein MPW15_27275 [Candidatus Manganitrophus sp.]|nr:hypothetical protein [Candidatus Manganitrophus sp.]